MIYDLLEHVTNQMNAELYKSDIVTLVSETFNRSAETEAPLNPFIAQHYYSRFKSVISRLNTTVIGNETCA